MLNCNQKEAIDRIADRAPFQASAMSGKHYNYTPSTGRLAPAEVARLNADFKPGIYIVFSYATPIAWFGASGWYVATQKFSPTTSKHQNYVRRAVAVRQAA
jgi:hypothetical protein